MKKLVLASGSPRRSDILRRMQMDFIVDIPAEYQELNSNSHEPESLAILNAVGKAREIAPKHKSALILGVDTIVALGSVIFEKPKDKEDAIFILKSLSGKTHRVLSGICLIDTDSLTEVSEVETTKVTFRNLSEEEIIAYVETGEPMDKSGAYAIQGGAKHFVEKIDGEVSNVVGLPEERFKKILYRGLLNLTSQN